MDVAVDIGNTNLKTFTCLPQGNAIHRSWGIPFVTKNIGDFVLQHLFRLDMPTGRADLRMSAYSKPITWRIIQTGRLDWTILKAEILKIRPKDKFKQITHKQIPLEIDVDYPAKVGIDRLVAAFSAVHKYGESPKLVVDAGTAITIDVVQNGTFRGGAILPGLFMTSQVYPNISQRLPLVPIPLHPDTENATLPAFPGKNTENAILNGLYWGTVGAIRQFYDRMLSKMDGLSLILTGGDAAYLLRGLSTVFPLGQIEFCDTLVVEGLVKLPLSR